MKKSLALLAGLTMATMAAGPALAEMSPDAAIAYRKQVMEVIGAHMKSIAAIVKGEVPYADQLALHADGLAASSGIAGKTFEFKAPSGGSEKTTAKADIWENFPKFSQSMDKFRSDADALKAAAASGDKTAVGAQLAALGKDCKGCHDDYRNK